MSNTVNTFLSALQGGRDMRQGEDRRKIQGMMASGDHQGAINMAAERGDLDAANAIRQQMSGLQQEQLDSAARLSMDIGEVTFAAKNIPPESRMQFAATTLVNKGYAPEHVQELIGKVASWDDATMTAIAQSSMDMEKQLQQFTTGTENVNDSMISTRTNNFTGQTDVKNSLAVAAGYADQTDRMRNEADARYNADKLAETRRSNQASERQAQYEGQTERRKANRPKETRISTKIVMGIDADGNEIPMQARSDGSFVPSQLPDGVSVKPSGDKTQTTSYTVPKARKPETVQPAAAKQKPAKDATVKEGTKIRNKKTGEVMIMRNGKWEPSE